MGDPPFIEWTSLLPTLTSGHDPSSVNECVSGKRLCLQILIREMDNRLGPLASSCDHNAVFALGYLRTTEEVHRATEEPGFFDEQPFVVHVAAFFARQYFEAFDAWDRQERNAVPAAWLLALDTAQRKEVSGSGNLLLGMNAHINRDLPFVLFEMGLIRPDGSSRKSDHDRVNEVLNRVVQPLLEEEARRFDPTMNDLQTPFGAGFAGLFQLLASWRESAWRHAERLANATDEPARQQIGREIEQLAVVNGEGIRAANAYRPPLTTSRNRDAFCAQHHG
jgi:hypothetical protein